MLFKFAMFMIFSCVLSKTPYSNLFEKRICNLTLYERNVTFHNSFVETQLKEDMIYFSACKDLVPFGCDENAVGCVNKNNKFINFIKVIERNRTSFTLISDEKCGGVKYEFQVSIGTEKYKLTKQGDCKYSLNIDPLYTEDCTKVIGDRKLVFKELSKDIYIPTDEETIIINICGTSKTCNTEDSAVCSYNNASTHISVLGHVSTENIFEDKENIVIRYKVHSSKQTTSIILKCNWTTALGHTSFKRKSAQKLEIIIETYLACAKQSRNCVISDTDNYIYNLTALSNFNGWKLITDKKPHKIQLNVCGPLKTENKLCSDQQSQVCCSDGEPLNYGSVMSPINVENDIVKFSFKDGSQCQKNSNLNLMTSFELHCSSKEEGPKLVKENDCGLEVLWRTPSACPFLNTTILHKPTKEYGQKSCTVEDGDVKYDLTGLLNNEKNYVLHHNELDFILNICRPVVEADDVFCQSSMGMCLKNNSEPNIKKRFVGIGGIQSPKIENGQLVLKYTHGFWCGKFIKEAAAIIYFHCSEYHDDSPTLLSEHNCFYEFNWKTKYACPKKMDCTLRDHFNKIINLEDMKTSLQFNNNGTSYNINICLDQLLVNISGQTHKMNITKHVYNDNKHTLIEYLLEKNCTGNNDFNIIKIYFDCDPLLNNEHYDFDNVSYCTAYLKYRHNDFCSKSSTVSSISNFGRNVPLNISTKIIETQPRNYYTHEYEDGLKNCIVQYKDREINLNNFKPVKILSSKKKHYTIGINKTSCCCHQFICDEDKPLAMLNKCPKVMLQNDELKLSFNGSSDLFANSEVVFYCKMNEALPEVVLESGNLVTFRYPLESLCDQSSTGSGSIIAGIVSCLFIILLCGLVLYNKEYFIRKCRREKKSATYVYCKNSED